MRRTGILALWCFVVAAHCAWACHDAALAQNRVALVIGNDRYPNLPADRQLSRAVNDARAVGNALEKIGFTVVRGENLDRQGMVDRIFAFTQKLAAGDTALVFFAGHGVTISGGNYLLPTDVREAAPGEEARVRNMAIGEADVLADIQERNARVTVLVLDACRDNPFRRPGLRSVGGDRGLARAREAEGVFAIYSAGFGQTALDRLGPNDRSPNSVFTRVLVPALARGDRHLGDLVIDVRGEVAKLAASVGHRQYPAYYDQTQGGRIYLAARTAAIPPISSLPPGQQVTQPKTPAPASKSAPPTGTISLAVAGPMTGRGAFAGTQFKQGVQQAAEDMVDGILGNRIDLTVEDDASDPKQGAAAAQQLAAHKVKFVIGHFSSPITVLTSEIYLKNNMVLITPSSTSPQITERGMWNVFRTGGRDDQQALVAAQYIVQNFKNRRIAIVHDGTIYGQSYLAEVIKKVLNSRGVREVMFAHLTRGDADIGALAARLKSANVDLVYWGGLWDLGGNLIKQMRELGVKATMMSGDGIADDEFARIGGMGAEGTLMTFVPDARTRPEALAVVSKLRSKGIAPASFLLTSYAAVEVIKQASEAAKSVDTRRVAAMMSSGMRFKTVLGEFGYDRKGDMTRLEYQIYVWKKGPSGRLTYFAMN